MSKSCVYLILVLTASVLGNCRGPIGHVVLGTFIGGQGPSVLSLGAGLRHHLIFFNVCGPVDSIAKRLSTAHNDREGPKQLIGAENLVPVVNKPYVVDAFEVLALLVQVLNGGFVGGDQVDVELHEECH